VPDLLFPDTTVLINFAIINRMDLLQRVTNGRGRWCATVEFECARSAQKPGLGALDEAPGIFGSAWYPQTRAEHVDVQTLRVGLARPGDSRRQHLGEAETLAIMIGRSVDGMFATDDRDAARLASKKQITVISTWDLMRLAARCGFVDADTMWGYLQTLGAKSRGFPAGVRDRATFDTWLV